MKKLIQKAAYKLCSTEVKMLLDKLDESKEKIGLTALAKNITPTHGYLHIVNTGKFSFAERIALASKMDDIHRTATKMTIVETIFEGEQRAESRAAKMSKFGSQTVTGSINITPTNYVPGEVISQRKIAEQAKAMIQQEIEKSYNDALRKHVDEHIDAAGALRSKGLL